MVSIWLIIGVLLLYMALLGGAALWTERRSVGGRGPANHPLVYALALGVYCTSWTFYGSVGKAATEGLFFLPVFLGVILSVLLWSWLMRRAVRLKEAHHITSVADFIAVRYGKSQRVAAVATGIAVIAVVPYIALQLKAILSTVTLMTNVDGSSSGGSTVLGLSVVAALIVFTILIGVRRIDPTERHPGLVMSLAVDGVVKLVAFIAVGAVVTWDAFDGFGDIFARLEASEWAGHFALSDQPKTYSAWTTYMVLAAFSVVLLPRQFHVAVVENSDERHVETASWVLPLYLLLINVFVFPIAIAGLLKGLPIGRADTFVLALPLHMEMPNLALLVFLGGFSAATAMVVMGSVTVATMVTNHLLLPVAALTRFAPTVNRNVLRARWGVVATVVVLAYVFERFLGQSYMLVNIGIMSFAAVLQFAPPVVAGMLWRRGNAIGTAAGMGAGLAVWVYTLLLPLIVRSGWLPTEILTHGPLGLSWLAPEALFGIDVLDPLSHGVMWSLLANLSCYVLAAAFLQPSAEEEQMADMFVGDRDLRAELFVGSRGGGDDAYISLDEKRVELADLLREYFPDARAEQLVEQAAKALRLADREHITIVELLELHGHVELLLAGAIGTAGAHRAVRVATHFTPQETQDLSRVYAKLLANLRVTPDELRGRVDYHREREAMVREHARQLQEKIEERDQEIAVRREAEAELERLAEAVTQAADGVIITDLGGTISFVNPAFAKMSGYSRDELIGHKVSMVESGEHDASYYESVWTTLASGTTWTGTFVNRHKDGTLYEVESSISPVRDDKGRLINYVALQHDRTRERMLERQVQEAQKLEALGTLAGGIAHDFNNLLMPIIGYTELTASHVSADETALDNLDHVRVAARRARDLVRQILAFARQGEQVREVVHLSHVASEAIAFLHATLPSNVAIALEQESEHDLVRVDSTQLHQVLMNLCTNAAQAIGDQEGQIHVSIEHVQIDETDDLPELDAGDYVRVSVTDTGPGLPDDVLPNIFDPFFTTKPRGKGTGLGLAVVHGIVRSHAGTILAQNREEGGARFEVYLPEQQGQPTPKQVVEPVQLDGNEHVLLVDDEDAIARLGRRALTRYGYTVTATTSGAEALQLFAKDPLRYDLVITDLSMPGLSGLELAQKVHAIRPEVPTILCTGVVDTSAGDWANCPGIRDVVMKPIAPDELVAAVRRQLDRAG